jgi:hypothetical protein
MSIKVGLDIIYTPNTAATLEWMAEVSVARL